MLFPSSDQTLIVDLTNLGRCVSCDSVVEVVIFADKNLMRHHQEKETLVILLLVKYSWQLKKNSC